MTLNRLTVDGVLRPSRVDGVKLVDAVKPGRLGPETRFELTYRHGLVFLRLVSYWPLATRKPESSGLACHKLAS